MPTSKPSLHIYVGTSGLITSCEGTDTLSVSPDGSVGSGAVEMMVVHFAKPWLIKVKHLGISSILECCPSGKPGTASFLCKFTTPSSSNTQRRKKMKSSPKS